jgi:6-phosphofructokinase
MAADKSVRRVALLTAGGLAPCLSSAVGGLIERYTEVAPDVEIIAYLNGYHGLLSGRFLDVTPEVREKASLLHKFGGSPIGNSRVKLTNTADLVKRGLIQDGQNALQVAAERLVADGVDVLHTIGGDDTNTTAADLAAYLHELPGGPVRLLGIDNLPGSLHLETMEVPRDVCFLFGQEGPGLSDAAREACDGTFSIATWKACRRPSRSARIASNDQYR